MQQYSLFIDIILSGESLSIKNEVKMPIQGNCSKCGYISSQPLCKACVLLEGLNRGLPRSDIRPYVYLYKGLFTRAIFAAINEAIVSF